VLPLAQERHCQIVGTCLRCHDSRAICENFTSQHNKIGESELVGMAHSPR
jgi:hypothetical protein